MPRTTPLLVLLLFAAILPGCQGNGHKAKATIEQSAEHVIGSAIDVQSRNGRIEIHAAPDLGEVRIEAEVTTSGTTAEEAKERLEAFELEVTRNEASVLTVRPVFPGGERSNDGATIIVRLPDANGVTATSSNGKVRVHGCTGPLVVDTSNGSITVQDHEGSMNLDTSNGSVRVAQSTGDVRLDTSNGSIILVDHDGAVRGSSSNGSITLNLVAGCSGPLDLGTSNGAVTITVGPEFAGQIDLGTSNGSITVTDRGGAITNQVIERTRATIVLNEGAAMSSVRTSNGRMALTVAGE